VTASKAARRKLVSTLVAIVDKHGLDGLDFDWEAPTTVVSAGDMETDPSG
jgi:GH18 family chitinase